MQESIGRNGNHSGDELLPTTYIIIPHFLVLVSVSMSVLWGFFLGWANILEMDTKEVHFFFFLILEQAIMHDHWALSQVITHNGSALSRANCV